MRPIFQYPYFVSLFRGDLVEDDIIERKIRVFYNARVLKKQNIMDSSIKNNEVTKEFSEIDTSVSLFCVYL